MNKKDSTSQLTAPQQPIEKLSPLSLQHSHSREHQVLTQSSSDHATPKRRTERVLSAPGAGAPHAKLSSGVSSSVSSAQIPPQGQHAALGSAALTPGRRHAPHQPVASGPTNRTIKPGNARPGGSVRGTAPASCASTAHGNEGSNVRQGSDMASIPEKIELDLFNVVERRPSPRSRKDITVYSADNSAFQRDVRPKFGETPEKVEFKASSVGEKVSLGASSPTGTTLSFAGTNQDAGHRVGPSFEANFPALSTSRTDSPAVAETHLSSPVKKSKLSVENSSEIREAFNSEAMKRSPSLCRENINSSIRDATAALGRDFNAKKTSPSVSPLSEKSTLIDPSRKKVEENVVNVVLRNDTKEHRIKLVSPGSTSRTSMSTTGGASTPGKKSITSETSVSPFEETIVSEPAANPLRPLSLQSNITLHIKPEAIHSVVPRPSHTALQLEFDSLSTPRKTVASVKSSPQTSISPETETKGEVCIDMPENSPLKRMDSKNPGKKATSFLTELLSQSSSRRSSKASSSLLKFWGGSKLKNKKQEFGSTVAMAGSNSSNSDSTASELSENSSLNRGLLEYNLLKSEPHKHLPRSGLCNEYFDATGAKTGQFPSVRHDSNSSSLGYGESSSLLASADPANSSTFRLSSKLPWRSAPTSVKPNQTNQSVLGVRESELNVPDAEQDDDEAWFDSVTKLNEQWFKPGAVTSLPVGDGPLLKDIASTDTPIGKSDVAAFRGIALFDGRSFGEGQGQSAHNSVAGELLNFKSKQLGANNSYGSLNAPMSKPTTTYMSFGTTSLTTELPNPRGGSQTAVGKYRTPTAVSLGSKYESSTGNSGLSQASNQRYNLRKQLHARAGLLRPQLQRKSHSSLMKTNIDDAGAVKEIEAGLLRLMEEFQAGNLRAFGDDSRLRQMEAIREQQESLARLHQEVGGSQDLYQPLSSEALRINEENMNTLMNKLECLSVAIEKLECSTAPDRKPSQADEVKSPDNLSQTNRTSENNDAVLGDEGKEPRTNNRSDEVEEVVLRKKGSSALLQKSVSLGKNSEDFEMSRIKKSSAAVARSSSQKHYDRKSGFEVAPMRPGDDYPAGNDVETPVRPASAMAFQSQETTNENILDTAAQFRSRPQLHRHHRHGQDDQKHTRKKSNKETVAKTDGAVLVDQQSNPKSECDVESTELRHFDSNDVSKKIQKRKSLDETSRSVISYVDADLITPQKQPPALPARPNRPLPSPVAPSKQVLGPTSTPSLSSPSPISVPQPIFSDSNKRRPPSITDSKLGLHPRLVTKPENHSPPVPKSGSSPLPGTHKVPTPASKQNPYSRPLLSNTKDSSAISYRSTAPALPASTRSQASVPIQSKDIVLQTTTYPYPHSRSSQASPVIRSDSSGPSSYARPPQTAPILPSYNSHSSAHMPLVSSATPNFYSQTRTSFTPTILGSTVQGLSISSSTSSSSSKTPGVASSVRTSSATSYTSSVPSSRVQTHPLASSHANFPHSSSANVTADSPVASERSSKKTSTEKTTLISGYPQR